MTDSGEGPTVERPASPTSNGGNRAVPAAVSLLAFAAAATAFWIGDIERPTAALLTGLAGIGAWLLFDGLTRKARRRAEIRKKPFPSEWEAILQRYVAFYTALDDQEKARFQSELQIFIGEKRITGIKTEVDEKTRVLAAASAIIPIFGFEGWEWDEIREILIYPTTFNSHYEMGDSVEHRTLGMVGTREMDGIMILSKPALLRGFQNPRDKRNVGIHEFGHLVDKSDGVIDGVPGVGLSRQTVGPWIELMRRKMAEMRRGESDIDPYGLTNEAEFFAVVSEYFFERPALLKRKHPELYEMLRKVFRQDMRSRAKSMLSFARRPRRFGRNSPCPCGSGSKYKKCCLRQAQGA